VVVVYFTGWLGGLGRIRASRDATGWIFDFKNLSKSILINGYLNMPDNTFFKVRRDANARTSAVTMQKWGGLASFLLAVTFVVAPLIYFMGNLRDAIGPLAYDLADFLYGPVWAASLVTAVFALRERIGERAPRQMTLALLAASLAAGAIVSAACIRSANRHYHLIHPELNLDMSTPVLVVWTTLVAGVIATGRHFLGWSLVLLGSAGWTTRRLPRVLSVLYLVGGTASLFVYLLPDIDEIVVALGVVVSIWQGILLWQAEPGETQAPEKIASQPDQA
jgi:hypothetical protein